MFTIRYNEWGKIQECSIYKENRDKIAGVNIKITDNI